MIYVTGDIHGVQNRWLNQIHPLLKENDILIVCGDFGVGLCDERLMPEEMFYDFISAQKYSVYFLDGNHEAFDKLNAYPIDSWCNGAVHKIRHNLIHLIRGEIYNIGGNSIFVFGGGNSLDKEWRKEQEKHTKKKLWWAEEMPKKEEYKRARDNLERLDYNIDYIFSHTLPDESRKFFNHSGDEELPLNLFLEFVRTKTFNSYKRWYFGHVHEDREIHRNQVAVYRNVRNIETNEVVIE